MNEETMHVICGAHLTGAYDCERTLLRQLREHQKHIRTQLRLNENNLADDDGPGGIILLELVGRMCTLRGIIRQLSAIRGVEVQVMVFQHENRASELPELRERAMTSEQFATLEA